MTSIASTTWSNFYLSSKSMTLVRALQKEQIFRGVSLLNFMAIWPGKIHKSKREWILFLGPSIAILTFRRIVICGCWSPLASTGAGELRYLTLFNNYKRYWWIIWCWWRGNVLNRKLIKNIRKICRNSIKNNKEMTRQWSKPKKELWDNLWKWINKDFKVKNLS